MKHRIGFRAVACAAGFWLAGCSLFAVSGDGDGEVEDPYANAGALITDSAVVIDDFHFSEAACAELVPGGFANMPKPDSGQGIALLVNSIACWKADVKVVDSNNAVVDSFTQAFGIFGQRDGEKERGHVGYLVWKPGNHGVTVWPGTYLFRIRFDFGAGRKLALRALVPWP
jgi:hypothetical protein